MAHDEHSATIFSNDSESSWIVHVDAILNYCEKTIPSVCLY